MAVGILPPQKGPIATAKQPLSEWLLPALRSTIGSKYLVAITGVCLIGFVFAHMAGNLLIYKDAFTDHAGNALNTYARGLKDLGPLLWVARIGLLVVFVMHIGLALRLKMRNVAARPDRYQCQATVQATLASRTMVFSGLVILAFVVYHLAHFTMGWVQSSPDGHNMLELTQPYNHNGERDIRHDVYRMVVYGFKNVFVSISYIIAQLALGLHLSHGISSIFQTLGWNAPRWWPTIKMIGLTLTLILVIGNCSIPLAVLLGVVK